MPCTEEAKVQDCDARNVTVRLLVVQAGTIERRNMQERLCRFGKLPSEDVSCCMPACNRRMIGRNGEGCDGTTLNSYSIVSRITCRRRIQSYPLCQDQ